mmetsp:Transcript_14451/g.25150  ORF Transcript_14451/g.25150 Transcript_14451/m.25150 type:complete len:89 (+) Transcript_14451:546-812(+)
MFRTDFGVTIRAFVSIADELESISWSEHCSVPGPSICLIRIEDCGFQSQSSQVRDESGEPEMGGLALVSLQYNMRYNLNFHSQHGQLL